MRRVVCRCGTIWLDKREREREREDFLYGVCGTESEAVSKRQMWKG